MTNTEIIEIFESEIPHVCGSDSNPANVELPDYPEIDNVPPG